MSTPQQTRSPSSAPSPCRRLGRTATARRILSFCLLALWLPPLAGCGSDLPTSGAERDVFVVRHAEAWSNVPEDQRGSRTGEAADALTPRGLEQGAAVAKDLASQGVTTVFHSPLGRTRATAEIIAKACGAPCIQLEGLRPIGPDETVGEAAARAIAALAARSEAGNWVIVSHSDTTSALLGVVDGTPEDQRLAKKLTTAGMRRVRWLANGEWRAP